MIDMEQEQDPLLEHQRPVPTGGMIVLLREDSDYEAGISRLQDTAQADVEVRSFGTIAGLDGLSSQNIMTFPEMKVAIIPAGVAQNRPAMTMQLAEQDDVEQVIPEFYVFVRQFADTAQATWGIQATNALNCPFTGKGIKIAILDTGIDLGHPDFTGRAIVSKSFVASETVDDVQGHGTHCAGTAVGKPVNPAIPRYGVAPDASLFVGKVLNNRGFGSDGDIITAMNWAVSQGCEVISMSLGSTVRPGETHNPLYERAARLALQNGSLVVAAAGNDSNRGLGHIAPVGRPANSPSIMAVGALNGALDVASFSNGGINPGGDVDIAGPGVGVFSSVPVPQTYATFMGTSMACPHVAGIAALWAQSDSSLRGQALWDVLTNNAQALPHPARDAGAGLVQAPSGAAQQVV